MFGDSVPSTSKPNQRYTYDADTNTLHRFYNGGNGIWHWSDSTNQGANSINGSQVPNDIKNIFDLPIDNEFCNGILLFCVDGDFFPKRIVTATLKCEIQPLKEKLMNLVVDESEIDKLRSQVFAQELKNYLEAQIAKK